MKHTATDAQLTAFALGELTGAERARVAAAIAAAPELRQEVAAIRQFADHLQAELAAEPALDLTPEQKNALLRAAPKNPAPWWSRIQKLCQPVSRPAFAWGLTATAVLVGLLLWPALQNRRHSAAQYQSTEWNARRPEHTNALVMVPLPIQFPPPNQKGTPDDWPADLDMDPFPTQPSPPFLAPVGVSNVALHKPVTASSAPVGGHLEQLTDGTKEAQDDQVVEFKKGLQYVQVDLQDPCQIFAIALWHDHRRPQVYRQVVIQIADDASFTQNVRTLFNNDAENRAGLGLGTDRSYFESQYGRIIDGKGEIARYVRWHSNGSSLSALNNRTEIEVYALPMAPLPVKYPAPAFR